MKKLDRSELKKILELVGIFEEGIAEIAASGEKQERIAASAMRELSDDNLSALLRSMDVAAVNKDKLGIRVSALRDAGILNMEQLCSKSYKELSRISGIGEESAYLIYKLAGKIKQELGSGVSIRINPDKKDELTTKVLVAVKTIMSERDYVEEAYALKLKYSEKINDAVKKSKLGVSWFKSLFASSTQKAASEHAAMYLYELLSGEFGSRARKLIKAWKSRGAVDAEQCFLLLEA